MGCNYAFLMLRFYIIRTIAMLLLLGLFIKV
jgi:hypothetical protein